MRHRVRLNQFGFDHLILSVGCFIVFALIGSAYLYTSLAATPSTWTGILEVYSQNSGYCLTTTGSASGSYIELDPCAQTYDADQVWSLNSTQTATVDAEAGVQEFEIQSASGNMVCITNAGASQAKSYPAVLSTCNASKNAMTWFWNTKFTSKGYSTHQLRNVAADNLCLDDQSDSDKAGTYVGVYTCKTTSQTNQEWFEAGAPSSRMFGYSTHILEQSNPASYTAFAENGGATTVRDDDAFQMASDETSKGVYTWTDSDTLMKYAVEDHLHVLMLTDTVASWSGMSDPSDFGTFVGQLAARYGPGGAFWKANPTLPKIYPAGIEIWNEENWDTTAVPPATYTALLKAAYTAVRAVYPAPAGVTTMPVIIGGLAPVGDYNDVNCSGSTDTPSSDGNYNGINYLLDVYKDGGGGYFDAVGWHPYNYSVGKTASEIMAYTRCSGWSQMDATSPSVVSVMKENGDASKKIWITEVGAPTCQSAGGSTYYCISEAQQSTLATDMVTDWKTYPWAGNFYWYDLRDDGGGTSSSDGEEHFGTVRGTDNTSANGGSNSLKPSYTALKNAYTGK